ncbi:MAG: DUF4214 domain-containing protein [Alphaproteobacteria bacterium]|nr:DUF4214 domain-containing protein [Alphaproteobacteria bacterium]
MKLALVAAVVVGCVFVGKDAKAGMFESDLQALYVAFFNRPVDPTGVSFWTDVANANGGDISIVASELTEMPEYKSIYSGISSDRKINTVYRNLFDRDPNPDSLLYWGKKLESGSSSLAEIAVGIANSAVGEDAAAFHKKIAPATVFTQNTNSTGEILGYSGDAANLVEKAWLSTVGPQSWQADHSTVGTISSSTFIASLKYVSDAHIRYIIGPLSEYSKSQSEYSNIIAIYSSLSSRPYVYSINDPGIESPIGSRSFSSKIGFDVDSTPNSKTFGNPVQTIQTTGGF